MQVRVSILVDDGLSMFMRHQLCVGLKVVLSGGVCTVGSRSYNCQCCFKKSGLGLVSVNTANKIVKNDKV